MRIVIFVYLVARTKNTSRKPIKQGKPATLGTKAKAQAAKKGKGQGKGKGTQVTMGNVPPKMPPQTNKIPFKPTDRPEDQERRQRVARIRQDLENRVREAGALNRTSIQAEVHSEPGTPGGTHTRRKSLQSPTKSPMSLDELNNDDGLEGITYQLDKIFRPVALDPNFRPTITPPPDPSTNPRQGQVAQKCPRSIFGQRQDPEGQ